MLSSSARVFGSIAKVIEGSGSCAGRIEDRRSFVAERIAGGRFLQFGDCADVSRMQFADFGELSCPARPGCAASAPGVPRLKFVQRRVVLQHAAHHFEIVDAPGERIGERLEHEQRERLGVVVSCARRVRPCRRAPVKPTLRVLIGMRENIRQEMSAGWRCRCCASAETHQHRENLFRDDGFAQRRESDRQWEACLRGKIPPSIRRRLRRPSRPAFRALPSLRRPARREFPRSLALPSPSGVYMCAFIATRSTTPRNPFSAADGQLQRHDVAPENLLQRFHASVRSWPVRGPSR